MMCSHFARSVDRSTAASLMTLGFHDSDDALTRQILTVGQLNRAVGQLLERNIPMVWVRGEISNFTQATSGHWYFTLKDSRAAVRAVMFRSRAQAVGFVPKAGEQVEIRAKVSLYEPRGDYQLQVDGMRRAGLGDLFEAFVQLKQKLEQEGLFAPERKRSLASIPRVVGVITSLQAAALHDVLTAFARRAPHVRVVVYPSPVQGNDAAQWLTQAVLTANRRAEVDTLLLIRGGGSIEDLWSFNDEILARAIADSRIPVISGVGHETDFTIADFVADLRAPTPTAAAELACLPRADLLARVGRAAENLARTQQKQLERLAQRLDRAMGMLISPSERLARHRERMAGLIRRMAHAWDRPHARRRSRLELVREKLIRCRLDTLRIDERLTHTVLRLQRAQAHLTQARATRLTTLKAQLRAFDPQNTLARGYSITRDAAGNIVRDASVLKRGDALSLTFGQGRADVVVDRTDTDTPT
jgi:exodeoxyribonuclease VII large subunit